MLMPYDQQEIQNGFVICNVKKPVKTTNNFEAQLAILDHKNIICAGYTAVLHIHTGIEEIALAVSSKSCIKLVYDCLDHSRY